MRFVGFRNFKKIFFGSEQYHLLGTFEAISALGWCLILVMLSALLWWLYSYTKKDFKLMVTLMEEQIALYIMIEY